MHTPRMCADPTVDAEAAAHWQDPDTVARVLKGRRDARCAGSFAHEHYIAAALPNRFSGIAAPPAFPHSRDVDPTVRLR
jgi:hypothetical protein